MDSLWAAAAAAAVLWLLLIWRGWRRKATRSLRRRSTDSLDTLSAWEPQATRVLTRPEQLAMRVLARAVPDHIVLAQVPLARFIRVPRRHSYAEWLRRVGQLSPDLLVCDNTSLIIAAVEVTKPEGKLSVRAGERLERMSRVLKAAGIPLHVWTEGQLPTPDRAREAILPAMTAAERAQYTPPAAAALATLPDDAIATQPMLEALDEDAEPDEIIEMREPPPSTWFDEDFDLRAVAPKPISPKAPERTRVP